MKTRLNRSFISLAIACIVFGFAPRLFAQTPANLLQQAYVTLEMADHDYKGHRAAAMKQIEAAGHELGISVHGNGHGHEQQGISDEQLRTAQSLLQQAAPGLKGRPLKHVNHALKQIAIALSIR